MARNLDARDFDSSAWWPIVAIARVVAEYEATWRANLQAVKRRGEDPAESASVKESFAHYSAAQRVLGIAVEVSYVGPVGRRGRLLADLIQQTKLYTQPDDWQDDAPSCGCGARHASHTD